MLDQYFGQYLLNHRIIMPDQLYAAMKEEQTVRVRIGVLAIAAGYMTAGQVEEVHAVQFSRDKRFGEIALELGYLSGAQLDELLQTQDSRSMSLSQAIVDKGFLSLETLGEALAGFQEETNLTVEQLKFLEDANYEETVRILLDFSTVSDKAQLYYDYTALTLRNIVRLLGDLPVIGSVLPMEDPEPKWSVFQTISGDIKLTVGFAMPEEVLLELAKRYSGESLTVVDELACDSAAEFVNVINGIFCVNLSEKGLETELSPQQVQESLPEQYANYRKVVIQTSFGEVLMLLE